MNRGEARSIEAQSLNSSGFSRRRLIEFTTLAAAGVVLADVGGALRVSPATASIAWYHPFAVRGTISSEFGFRNHPLTGEWKLHAGTDYSYPLRNSPIYAVAAGTVSVAKFVSGYGICAIIDHADGYQSVYGHMVQDSLRVVEGQTVKASAPVGLVGATGGVTGPHLHMELRKGGVAFNAKPFLHDATLAGQIGPVEDENEEDEDMSKVVLIGDPQGLWVADLGAKTKYNVAAGGLDANGGIARKNVFVNLGIPFYDKQSGVVLAGFTDITAR